MATEWKKKETDWDEDGSAIFSVFGACGGRIGVESGKLHDGTVFMVLDWLLGVEYLAAGLVGCGVVEWDFVDFFIEYICVIGVRNSEKRNVKTVLIP